MKYLFLLLTVISTQSFSAGYNYGSGSDRDRMNNCNCDKSQNPEVRQRRTQPDQGSDYQQQTVGGSRQRGFSIFQIKGITIGKSNRADLAAVGALPAKDNSYRHQGYDFWYNPTTDSVYSIVLSGASLQTWPTTWSNAGFQPHMKYRDFISWMETSGFLPIKSSGHLEGTMVSNQRVLIIKIDFNEYSEPSNVTLLSTLRLSGRGN